MCNRLNAALYLLMNCFSPMVIVAVSLQASWYKLKILHLYCPLCAVVTHGIYVELKKGYWDCFHYKVKYINLDFVYSTSFMVDVFFLMILMADVPGERASCVLSWAPRCGTTRTAQAGWPPRCTPGSEGRPQTPPGTEAEDWYAAHLRTLETHCCCSLRRQRFLGYYVTRETIERGKRAPRRMEGRCYPDWHLQPGRSEREPTARR